MTFGTLILSNLCPQRRAEKACFHHTHTVTKRTTINMSTDSAGQIIQLHAGPAAGQ